MRQIHLSLVVDENIILHNSIRNNQMKERLKGQVLEVEIILHVKRGLTAIRGPG